MINLFKKGFIYLALMLIVLVTINVEKAAAEEIDYEEGVSNFNNTPENSAVVRDIIKKPEIGWKRYDDLNPKIIYTEKETTIYRPITLINCYKSSASFFRDGETATFIFKGTKFRLIGAQFIWGSKRFDVIVDDEVVDTASMYDWDSFREDSHQISYELKGLPDTLHKVTIKPWDRLVEIDAIDVDGLLMSWDDYPHKNEPSIAIMSDNKYLNFFESQQSQFIAEIRPESSLNKNVIWSSSDDSIATVDQNGNVTAIREGEAIITAKVENTNLVATIKVTVKKSTLPPITLTSLSATSGPVIGGNGVYILGTNFNSKMSVFVDGKPVLYTYLDAGKIRIDKMPAAKAAGTVDIMVEKEGLRASIQYTYSNPVPGPPITVTGLSVINGPVKGGNAVFILGTNFNGTMKVTVDGITVPYTYLDTGKIRIDKMPAAKAAGTVDIMVEKELTQASIQYTYY